MAKDKSKKVEDTEDAEETNDETDDTSGGLGQKMTAAKEESEETSEDEENESEEHQNEEENEGTEGVTVPEEFQKEVHSLLQQCDSKECLEYIRSAVYKKEDDIRKAEMKTRKPNKSPDTFSSEDMPLG
jgi:hypothetical protein